MARKKMHLELKKGALHKALGVPADEKIPQSKLAIHEGDSELMKRRKRLAKAMARWAH